MYTMFCILLQYEFREGKRKKIVHKTVQVWFNDVHYNEPPKFDVNAHWVKPYTDEYGYKMLHPIINKLSRRIEHATR